MDTASQSAFDPYHKWLGIRGYRAAPNPYRLLGIDLFETDEEVIRDAALRQMTHLKNYRSGPNRATCERIMNEVVEARLLLLDPDRKATFDRDLKLKTATSHHGGGSLADDSVHDLDTPTSNGILGGIGGTAGRARPGAGRRMHAGDAVGAEHGAECSACGVKNPSGRQFCSACGVRLWEPCLKCMKLNPGKERHCGACGANLADELQQTKDKLKAQLDQAAAMRKEYQHSDAVDLLLALHVPEHSELVRFAERQQEMLVQLRDDSARVIIERDDAIRDGRNFLNEYDYEQAALALERVPPPYRNESHQAVLDEVRSKQIQMLTLVSEIQQAIAEKRLDGLQVKVEELLRIKPDHFEARQLREQLRPLEQRKLLNQRDVLYRGAAAEIARHNYAAALKRLEQIPDESRTSQIVTMINDLRSKAAETAWLTEDLQLAVAHDEHLLPVAERLLRLRPADPQVAGIVTRLRHRGGNGASGANGQSVFPQPPETSVWGPPLESITRFSRISTSNLKSEAFAVGPDRFCVAAGLALQGLGQCMVQVNLAPSEKAGMLSGLFKPRKRPITSAWGIDLGRASLKAIKLGFDEESNQVVAHEAVYLEHRKLNQAEGDADDLLKATVQKFLSQVDLGRSAICASVPANKVLFRSLALPVVDEKKVPDLMRFEAQQQTPFPLDEVIWGYQMLSSSETEVKVVRDCEAILAALRLEEANAAVAPFVEKKVKVEVLQSDATALLNFYLHETGLRSVGGPDGQQIPAEAAAGGENVTVILDVGTDCSNLIVTNTLSVVVRSIPVGGDAFSRALVKEFQLTFAQAEKLKRNPTAVRELHRMYSALEPRVADLVRETQRTVDAFLQQDRSRQVKRFIVLGGGVKMHGALRRLWHGDVVMA